MSADDLRPRPGAGARARRRRCRRSPRPGSRWPWSALLVVGAWFYGRSSTAPDRAAADATRLRMMLLEARAQVLDAQLSLYAANFGNAAQHLEYAKPPLAAASGGARGDQDLDDLATKADARPEQVTTARDLAAKLSLDANSRAGEASKLLGEVLVGPAALSAATSGSSPSLRRVYSRPVSPSAACVTTTGLPLSKTMPSHFVRSVAEAGLRALPLSGL